MDIQTCTISVLFRMVRKDWKNTYFGAVPYIDALLCCQSLDSMYGVETARDLIPYFLANANTWRGDVARMIKKELKRRLENR